MEKLPNIKNQLSSQDLFNAFKRQLVKDFDQSNFPSAFIEALEPNYDTIHDRIVAELQRNEKRSDFNVMQLLYRVDISEAQLKRYLSEKENQNHYQVMAELIIKRVLQKVVTKQYYKNNENL